MKKFFLSPFFAPIFVITYVGILCSFFIGKEEAVILGFTDFLMEIITFSGYALTFMIVLCFYKDFNTLEKRKNYGLFLFLLIAAVLREMGVQHWIPSKDTTAFKLRFFTNPDNPLSEKLLSAALLISVFSVIIYLLVKYLPSLIRGFFKMNTICWTICTLGGTGVVAKFADRFPSNYVKWAKEPLDPFIKGHFTLLEETSEAALPLLFAIAVVQAHYLAQKAFVAQKTPISAANATPTKAQSQKTKKGKKTKRTKKKKA